MDFRALFLFILLFVSVGYASFEEDVKGLPSHWNQEISADQYVPVEAHFLVHAKVLWVNHALMREKSYSVNAQDILKAWAWSIPSKNDSVSIFSEEKKTFYASRYGGEGISVNEGDGRAAIAGNFQIKGIGRTPLAKKSEDGDHANGKAELEEAMREAFWGEINQAELPYGGNRILAIIDRGTTTIQENGTRERDVLIVRENPLRPAHFLNSQDDSLVNKNGLLRGLSPEVNQAKISKEKKIEARLAEFIKRIAQQYATAYARQIYHGATSQSNIDLSGRFLDYGTQTGQTGHGKLQILEHVEAAGENEEIKRVFIDHFAAQFLLNNKKNTRAMATRKRNEWRDLYDETYLSTLRSEFLIRLGVLPEIIKQMENSAEAIALADRLIQIAKTGAVSYIGKYEVPENVTKYNLGKVIMALVSPQTLDKNEILQSLKLAQSDLSWRNRLADLYIAFQEKAIASGSTNLLKVYEQAAQINRPRPRAYRWLAMKRNYKVIEQYMLSKDSSIIQNEIDSSIRESIRVPYRPAPGAAGLCRRIHL